MTEISSTGDQMLTVLLTIARRGPATTTEIASMLNINRTVAYRLVSTLHQRAFVRRRPDGYVLGPMVVRLADAVESDLRRIAMPAMLRLVDETGETIVLHSIDGQEAVVIDQAVSDRHVLRVQHQAGSRHPLSSGASGRALLAFQPAPAVERVVRGHADPAWLRGQIEQIRRSGHAISADELQRGVHGLAAPILDAHGQARATIAVLVPTERSRRLAGHAERVKQSAGGIAALLSASAK
jgi:DNA-binding IclR family transcriptional regulator